MERLEALNEEVLQKIKFIDKNKELSNPLLISKKATGKILYMGQETNTWYGSHAKVNSFEELEKHYEWFFLNNNIPSTSFWRFIREASEVHDLANDGNIIWSNLFVCSNVDKKGTPNLYQDITDVSIDYLLNIIDIFKIEKIISVVGPKNPYYNVFNKLVSELGWHLDSFPKVKNPVVYSDNDKLLYTYHPEYLNRSKNFNLAVKSAKKFINLKT